MGRIHQWLCFGCRTSPKVFDKTDAWGKIQAPYDVMKSFSGTSSWLVQNKASDGATPSHLFLQLFTLLLIQQLDIQIHFVFFSSLVAFCASSHRRL